MTALDPIFAASTDLLMDLDGEDITIRRPHTVKRIAPTASAVTSLRVQATALLGASSLIAHVHDSGSETRARGVIFSGFVLTIGGTNYTLSSDATFGATTVNRVTIAFTPVLDAEATVGDTFTLPEQVDFTGFRRLENIIGAQSYDPQHFGAGTKILQIEPPATLPTGFVSLRADPGGDIVLDEDSAAMGRISRITDEAPDAVEVILE